VCLKSKRKKEKKNLGSLEPAAIRFMLECLQEYDRQSGNFFFPFLCICIHKVSLKGDLLSLSRWKIIKSPTVQLQLLEQVTSIIRVCKPKNRYLQINTIIKCRGRPQHYNGNKFCNSLVVKILSNTSKLSDFYLQYFATLFIKTNTLTQDS